MSSDTKIFSNNSLLKYWLRIWQKFKDLLYNFEKVLKQKGMAFIFKETIVHLKRGFPCQVVVGPN